MTETKKSNLDNACNNLAWEAQCISGKATPRWAREILAKHGITQELLDSIREPEPFVERPKTGWNEKWMGREFMGIFYISPWDDPGAAAKKGMKYRKATVGPPPQEEEWPGLPKFVRIKLHGKPLWAVGVGDCITIIGGASYTKESAQEGGVEFIDDPEEG